MRVFALSDIHIDYEANARWVADLSTSDYQDDVLILAGDVSDSLKQLDWCLRTLTSRFCKVLFVPGNHDLWVIRSGSSDSSLEKFEQVCAVAEQSGASMQVFAHQGLFIVPLLGWYDYSFGQPSDELRRMWMDYRACRWPAGWEAGDITSHFLGLNRPLAPTAERSMTISFSHFLPRIDVMPRFIPVEKRSLYPVLGTSRLDAQLRELGSQIHVYGHSHVNRRVVIDDTVYINNAFAYPHETHIAEKALKCICEWP
jgi:predicted phosphodiesterase